MTLPRIILPWAKTSKMSGNGRLCWRAKADAVKRQRAVATALALEAGWKTVSVPGDARVEMNLIYCPPSRGGVPDDDNVLAAHKGHRDALADVLGVDDRRFSARATLGCRAKDGAVIVDARIVEAREWQPIHAAAQNIAREALKAMMRARANA